MWTSPVKRSGDGVLPSEVREICPKTGDYIEAREIPKILTIRHFMLHNPKPPEPLGKMRRKMFRSGLESFTEKEINNTYDRIKRLCKTHFDTAI